MKIQNRNYSVVLVLLFALLAPLSSLAASPEAGKPIVVINTFDVQGSAEDFMTLMDEARATAKKLNPDGQGKTRILSGNIGGSYANLITVATTYPNMEAYSQAYLAYENNAQLEQLRVKLDEAGFKVVHRSINTVVAEY